MHAHIKMKLAVFLFFCGFVQIIAATSTIAADTPMLAYDAKIVGDEDRARLLLEFNEEPVFKIRYLPDPNRIIIDLKKTRFGFPEEDFTARGILSDIRYGSMSEDKSRIVLSLSKPAVIEDQQVQVLEDGRHRLVMDISASDQDEFNAVIAEQKWEAVKPSSKTGRVGLAETKKSNKFVIVLDAGHGGIDGGAEGRKGAIEKDITLAFVQKLKEALSDYDDFDLVLTRSDDSFLSLSARVQIARRKEADLFISIHADSIRQRSLRGASIYTLSQEASDEFASTLAEAENLTDVLAGLHIEDVPDEVTGILVDLARRETQLFSDEMADKIVSQFKGQIGLINNPHRRAGFRVLQAPDVPSVLIELGFLSNQTDEKLLTDPKWRAKTTKLLARSLDSYKSSILSVR